MDAFEIDEQTGAVRLPNGLHITDALTKDAFLADPIAANARDEDYGTLPWVHYHLAGGEVEGKPLRVSLCFYDQLLVYVSITADLYPPGPKDWSNYSLQVEAATKLFHEKLLHPMFKQRPEGAGLFGSGSPSEKDTLNRPLGWQFAWGTVGSYHDSRGGGTYIHVGYGNRKEECNRAYMKRK